MAPSQFPEPEFRLFFVLSVNAFLASTVVGHFHCGVDGFSQGVVGVWPVARKTRPSGCLFIYSKNISSLPFSCFDAAHHTGTDILVTFVRQFDSSGVVKTKTLFGTKKVRAVMQISVW